MYLAIVRVAIKTLLNLWDRQALCMVLEYLPQLVLQGSFQAMLFPIPEDDCAGDTYEHMRMQKACGWSDHNISCLHANR